MLPLQIFARGRLARASMARLIVTSPVLRCTAPIDPLMWTSLIGPARPSTIVPESTLSGLTFAEAPPIRRADIEGPIRWNKQPSLSQARVFRSEEHTSELQSLMRIEYAVHS